MHAADAVVVEFPAPPRAARRHRRRERGAGELLPFWPGGPWELVLLPPPDPDASAPGAEPLAFPLSC